MKTDKLWFYPLILIIVGIISFAYIFNEKIDLNGDNCVYFGNATSIVSGYGYSDILHRPTTNYPPGYPLLMVPVRLITDSVIPQKILNGIFLIAGAVFLYFSLLLLNTKRTLAFVCGCAVLLIPRLLAFSTMMMAEASCFCFAALAILSLLKVKDWDKFYRSGWFYLMLFSLVYCYHIRTQGVVLAGSVVVVLLFMRRFKGGIATALLFFIGCLPWIIRNKALGLNQSRYLDQIMGVNLWRPEEGTLTLGGVIERFFDTLKMLVTQAIPSAITPFFHVDFSVKPTFGLWLAGVALCSLILFGFWRFGKYRWIFILYFLGTLAMVSLSNTPSEDRYLITILPLLTIGLFVGIWNLISLACKKTGIKRGFLPPPWFLAILLVLSFSGLRELHSYNRQPFPSNYQNFFMLGKTIKKNLPDSTVVCSRKPELLYVYAGTQGVRYLHSSNDTLLLRDMMKKRVDYVILEQLGYSSTGLYLYPAIQKNPELFSIVSQMPNPDTYLLFFDRKKAEAKFGKK